MERRACVDFLLTREPVFYGSGGLYAYDIKYRQLDGSDASGAEGGSSNGYFGVDLRRICGGATAFVGFSREMLKNSITNCFSSEDIVVVISGRDILSDREAVDACKDLKRRGYSFAIDDFKRGRGFDELLELCDVVMLDFAAPKTAEADASYICRFTSKRILAMNINTCESFDFAKRIGCSYVRGDFFLKPKRDLRSLQPLPISIVKAMKIMMKPDPNVDELTEVLSQDTAVCQKILRLINSAYFGVTNKISSIGQAIIVLGLDYLREWIYMLAIQHITQNENSELMRKSLIMAKFCRMLAKELPEAESDAEAFYLMGLMSILVFSRDRVVLSVLEELPLTDEIKNGILRQRGLYGDVFGMAEDLDMGRWEHFKALAGALGIGPLKAMEMFVTAIEESDRVDFGE